MKRKNIPVFFTIDDNYVNYLITSLASLIDHSSQEYKYDIHVLTAGLKPENRELISKYERNNVSITFDDASHILDGLKEHLPVRDYYSHATYYRLFISSIYTQYDKVLYLDSDIIVNQDVAKLYLSPIGNNLVGAARDSSVTIIKEFAKYVYYALDINPLCYFNAGILVMNLKQMRKVDFENQIYNLLMRREFPVAQDQDVLNTICKNKVFYFAPRWNKMPLGTKIKNPYIIHYNLVYKPWKLKNVMYEEYFWKYAEQTNLTKEFVNQRNAVTDIDLLNIQIMMKRLKKMCLEEALAAIKTYEADVDTKDWVYAY